MININNEKSELTDLRNGSVKAFETIYNRYSGKLYNFIMTISKGDKYMSEEIVQSTFIRLWEVHEQIDPQQRILSFLSTIAKNLLFNKYKRQTIEYIYQEYALKKQNQYDNTTENEIDLKWLEEFVNELIEQLPPSRKRIFILKKKEDLSTKQIAEIMKISVSTVETQISLAMKFIRTEFEKNYDKLFYLALLVNFF
ncbi:MAG: RNA polymerase sigma-70 factor [Dysgonamonadaceae bacterium]|nr:RNA polymerase sigma-70 factor [Dysgonamonadaceae bacterium]MDD3357159.1 RNA polymerase sigma-70 factor [Dysgonamonadaceae bacterium]MDD3728109.1 RNA polymerase sigma-70 factor [Dysgonamonadaceae bacterium]MDD4246018.1 RNA polymerase sigma-70 factor [Dysgonamonadaceae bacterium]MDD4606252.1 RNA polymerase sigma-70 factor [Dysgonamonadaceae bacterium]